MATQIVPVEVFCSYAHEDEAWLQKLETHLSLLKRQGLIALWHDRLISPGTNWACDIDRRLEAASVILLLVSADFFASDYCSGIEMERALERQEAGEARVIPIMVRSFDWKDAPFAHLQVLPTNAIPIASWMNTDMALTDVTAGLRRVIVEDLPQLSASASRATLPKIWNISYQRNPFFTGRDKTLNALHKALNSDKTGQPQALKGLGGMGKTHTAIEYAYRYCDEYQAILWVPATTSSDLQTNLISLAATLNLPEQTEREQDAVLNAVKQWLRDHSGWLLILDNVEVEALESVRSLYPWTHSGHVIITTRSQSVGTIALGIPLEKMEMEEGTLFLLHRAKLIDLHEGKEQAKGTDYEKAKALYEVLGGLPLALDQAAAYIDTMQCNLSTYLQLYQKERAKRLSERGSLTTEDHPESVMVTFSLAFQRVVTASLAAGEFLQFCAFLSPDAIPEEIITHEGADLSSTLKSVATDLGKFNEMLKTLLSYSLIHRSTDSKTDTHILSIHRLVQAVLRDSMSLLEQKVWTRRVFNSLKSLFPWSERYDNIEQSARLISHAQVCIADAQIWRNTLLDDLELTTLLFRVARYFQDQARYEEAESLQQQVLDTFKQLQEPGHAAGQIPEDLKRVASFSDMIPLQQRLNKMLGPESLGVIMSLNDLFSLLQEMMVTSQLVNQANLYRDQGKYEQAEPLYQQALYFYDQVLEPRCLQAITSFNNLTDLIKQKLEPECLDWVASFRELAESLNKPTVYSSQSYLLAGSLGNLANLYEDQGKYEQAEFLQRRALRIFKQILGPEDLDVAKALNNLANLYREQGKYEQAEPLYQKVLNIRKETLGVAHPNTALALNNLASLYREQGKYEQAEPLHIQALNICEEKFSSNHPEIALALGNLAILYSQQGKYEQAEPLYQKVLNIRKETLGVAHPNTALALNNLASLYREQGKYEQAEPLYQRALRIWEQQLGLEHPLIAYPLNGLANLYREQKKYGEAKRLYERALHIREQQLGLEHPLVADPLNGLANLCREQEKYGEAKRLYERALHIREQQLGPKHPETAETLYDVAVFQEILGNRQEALSHYQRALTIREQSLGSKHPETQKTQQRLTALLQLLSQESFEPFQEGTHPKQGKQNI